MKHFHSSMSCGDIIYALPFIRHIHEKTGEACVLHITQSPHVKSYNTLDSLRDLLNFCCPYLAQVRRTDNRQRIDYDLDLIRTTGKLRKEKYWRLYFQVFDEEFNQDSFRPWLSHTKSGWEWWYGGFNRTYHITKRFKPDNNFDWIQDVILKRVPFTADFFIGFDSEFQPWSNYFHHQKCENLYDMAKAISQSKEFFCNQSVGLTLAQGMGHENINLAVAKGFTSVYGLRNENLLNR